MLISRAPCKLLYCISRNRRPLGNAGRKPLKLFPSALKIVVFCGTAGKFPLRRFILTSKILSPTGSRFGKFPVSVFLDIFIVKSPVGHAPDRTPLSWLFDKSKSVNPLGTLAKSRFPVRFLLEKLIDDIK
eukprot:NODE_555_length_6111_cov_0.400366.p3 type:complete len:130 gc:universal NODE_555_length_6111_cov_0.400366:1174-1563(+)